MSCLKNKGVEKDAFFIAQFIKGVKNDAFFITSNFLTYTEERRDGEEAVKKKCRRPKYREEHVIHSDQMKNNEKIALTVLPDHSGLPIDSLERESEGEMLQT